MWDLLYIMRGKKIKYSDGGASLFEPVGERRQAKIPKNFGEDAAITYPFLSPPVIFFGFFFSKTWG